MDCIRDKKNGGGVYLVVEENLGKKIDQVDKNAQYDNCAKRLLAEKIVLANILKYSVFEFESYSI